MKILLVTPEYPPFSIGGGASVYENLAKNYLRLGHQVSVIYGYYPTKSISEKIKCFNKGKIQYYQLPELPTPSFSPDLKIRMPLNWHSLKEVDQILEKEKPDVAHLHGYGFLSIDMIAKKLRQKDIPYLLTIHGWPIKQKSSNMLVKLVAKIYFDYFSRQTLVHAQKISTVSNFLKNCLEKQLKKKAVTIYNPFIQPKKYIKNSIKINKRIKKQKITILSLGRIAQIKGFQEVIDLLPNLLKSGLQIKYLIAGSDEGHKQNLELRIQNLGLKKHVEFIEQLSESEKWQAINQADFVAIPSLIEGFGLVCLEASFLNKPILYGQSEAVQEILRDYPNKLSIYDPKLTGKMTNFKLKKQIFDFSPFNETRIAKQYLHLLKELR